MLSQPGIVADRCSLAGGVPCSTHFRLEPGGDPTVHHTRSRSQPQNGTASVSPFSLVSTCAQPMSSSACESLNPLVWSGQNVRRAWRGATRRLMEQEANGFNTFCRFFTDFTGRSSRDEARLSRKMSRYGRRRSPLSSPLEDYHYPCCTKSRRLASDHSTNVRLQSPTIHR